MVSGPSRGAHFGGQSDQRGHGGKAVGDPANLRQTAHLRADAKRIHPARRRTKGGLVQDEPAVAPVFRARIDDRTGADGEIGRAGRSEEIGNLGLCCKGAIRAARLPRRFSRS